MLTEDTGFNSPAPGRFLLAVILVSAVWILLILQLHAHNSRLLPSWHGFLHAAIANRFPSESIPPENPFFAGEPLRYYWFYHYAGYQAGRLLETDLLHAFRLIAPASLVVLVFFGACIGYRRWRSLTAGLLIGYLALAGANSLGPAIALAKRLIKGTPLWDTTAGQGNVETIFAGNRDVDDWMTQPLLPALHISSDWRHGQNVVWFLDISSRAPALALVVVLLFFLTGTRRNFAGKAGVAVITALITALNPISGFAVAGSLLCAHGILKCMVWKKGSLFKAPSIPVGPLLAGLGLALPFYFHLLLSKEGTFSLTPALDYGFLKLTAISANYFVLAPVAIIGAWRADPENKRNLHTIALAGILLLMAVPTIVLWPHNNEHNLTNPALCFLAVPAGVWVGQQRWNVSSAVFILFLPITICTFLAYSQRPGVPLAFYGGLMHRMPLDSPLETLYQWIRNSTSKNAVFLIDPAQPVKMSGNVSELPAFTARTLFVDHPSYLTVRYKDEALRKEIAHTAVNGDVLTRAQESYLSALHRPLYIVTYRAQEKELLRRLQGQHGQPLFQRGFVAVFEFKVG